MRDYPGTRNRRKMLNAILATVPTPMSKNTEVKDFGVFISVLCDNPHIGDYYEATLSDFAFNRDIPIRFHCRSTIRYSANLQQISGRDSEPLGD